MKKHFYLLLLSLLSTVALGQASITNFPYSQNFDGIGSTTTAALPTGFKLGANTSDYNAVANTLVTTQAAGTSGSGALTGTSTGGAYNFASGINASTTDRAIGFLSSTSFTSPRDILFAFTNNTGNLLSTLNVTFDYEKYRNGTRAFDFTFFHGSSASSITTAASDGNQNYVADAANAVTNPSTSISKTISLTGLSIANGATYYLRWRYAGVGGGTNSQGLGIDNITISSTVSTNPSITASPINLSGLNYLENNGPSTGVSYSLSGLNLTPSADNITVTAPANFEVSSSKNGTYNGDLTVAYTGGTLSSTPIFVRLKAGLAVGNYDGVGINVTNTGGGATSNVTVSGSVTNGQACGNATDIATVRATIPAQQTYTGSSGITITGSITGIFGANKIYVQDATGGIAVFFTNVVTTNGLVLGDIVRLTGTTARFNGESEIITLTCISKVSSGTVPAPTVFDSNNPPTNIALNDFLATNEGKLIKIISANIQSSGTFVASTNYTVISCNNQGGTEIRIDPTATNLIGTNIPTVTQDIIGLVGHFINATGTDKLQLFPSLTTDLANSTTTCSVSGGCGLTTFTEDPNKLDIFNWNIEWLGHPTNGPSQSGTNDITQITNATNIIKNVNADVYMLQEICQYNSSNPIDISTAFGTILKGLNDTYGANTFSGECSSAYSTSVADANPQRVCIIYKNSVVTKIYSKPMFENFTPATYPPTGTPSQFWASGRKPFKFMAKVTINNQIDTILFVGLHAKSGSDLTSYGRRKYDVKAMYDTLQAEFPTRKTIVLGDLNDDMDKSIAIGQISSYVPFLYTNPDETLIAGTRPSAFWNPISKALSDANCASTASFPDYIDHQIISNEFYDNGVTGIKYSLASVSSFRPVLANYSTTTSDHYPTVSRFEFGTICPQTLTLIDPTDSYSSGVQIKQAAATNGKIIATNLITGTSNTTFQAKSIELNAGFKADNGTVFKAEIGGCN